MSQTPPERFTISRVTGRKTSNPTREPALNTVEFIADDELVEVTPKSIRMRKRYLSKDQRMKYAKQIESQDA